MNTTTNTPTVRKSTKTSLPLGVLLVVLIWIVVLVDEFRLIFRFISDKVRFMAYLPFETSDYIMISVLVLLLLLQIAIIVGLLKLKKRAFRLAIVLSILAVIRYISDVNAGIFLTGNLATALAGVLLVFNKNKFS